MTRYTAKHKYIRKSTSKYGGMRSELPPPPYNAPPPYNTPPPYNAPPPFGAHPSYNVPLPPYNAPPPYNTPPPYNAPPSYNTPLRYTAPPPPYMNASQTMKKPQNVGIQTNKNNVKSNNASQTMKKPQNVGIQTNKNNVKSNNASQTMKKPQNAKIQTNQNNANELKENSRKWKRYLKSRNVLYNKQENWSCKNDTVCLWIYNPLFNDELLLLRNNKNQVWALNEMGRSMALLLKNDMDKKWKEFVYHHATTYGWEEFRYQPSSVINNSEIEDDIFPASIKKSGKYVFPDGKEMGLGYPYHLAKHYWRTDTQTGTREDLYKEFLETYKEPKIVDLANYKGKWLGIYNTDDDEIDFSAPEPVSFTFNLKNTVDKLKIMGSSQLGDTIKWATHPIAESTRDFITSLKDEQIITTYYTWLYEEDKSGKHFRINGYLYIITRTNVYRSPISCSSFGKKINPLEFKVIYQFTEPLNAQLCDIFRSYGKTSNYSIKGNLAKYPTIDAIEMERTRLEQIINAIPTISNKGSKAEQST